MILEVQERRKETPVLGERERGRTDRTQTRGGPLFTTYLPFLAGEAAGHSVVLRLAILCDNGRSASMLEEEENVSFYGEGQDNMKKKK